MDVRHLQMIREVVATGNLTKAAERLFLTQSALSHQLKEVEAYFNTQLFIRDKKLMRLTQAGAVVLRTAEVVLSEIDEAKRKIKCMTDQETGEVRLSTECYTSYHWLSAFLKSFRTKNPKVDIKVEVDATYNSENFLLEDKLDVAILEENTNPKLSYTPLFQDEFVVIVADDHPWVGRQWIEVNDFADQPYIMYNIPNEQSTTFATLFHSQKPTKVYKVTLTEAMIEMVKAGLGVAVLPNWVIKPYVDSGQLVAIPLTRQRMLRTWYAATLKNKQLPAYTHQFIEHLAQNIHKLERYAVE